MIWQIAYGLCLMGLWFGNAPRAALVPLSCNFIATLAVCGAMDMGWIGRETSTGAMMIMDFATGVYMVRWPGLPRVVAMFYAVTLPLYAGILFFSLPQVACFGVITAMAFLQLGVVASDGFSGGGTGGGKRGRKRVLGYRLAKSPGSASVAQRAVECDQAALRGGLDGTK